MSLKATTALTGLVGWEQPINPAMPVITASNKTASSHRYFNDNNLVTIEALKNCQEYKDITTEQFNALLAKIQNKAIISVCDNVFDVTDFIQSSRHNAGRIEFNEVDNLPTGFVGYRFEITENEVAFEIPKLYLSFQNTGNLKLLLFDAEKLELVDSKTIAINSNSTQEEILNWICQGVGRYYIGYIATDLMPYSREQNCNFFDNVKIRKVNAPEHTTETKPIYDDIESYSDDIGINFDLFVYKDYTYFIEQNKRLFAKAVQLAGQISVINTYLTSIRTNGTQRIAKGLADELLMKVEGYKSETINIKGLKSYFSGEVKNIQKELNKLKRGYHAYGFGCNIQQ